MRGGKARAYTPAKTVEAEWRIRSAFLDWFPNHQPFTGPVELHVVVWRKMPTGIPKARRHDALPIVRPDADNYLKTVLDALNGVAFTDDSQVVTVNCSKRYASPTQAPAYAITIRDLVPVPVHAPPGVAAHEPNATSGIRRKLGHA